MTSDSLGSEGFESCFTEDGCTRTDVGVGVLCLEALECLTGASGSVSLPVTSGSLAAGGGVERSIVELGDDKRLLEEALACCGRDPVDILL